MEVGLKVGDAIVERRQIGANFSNLLIEVGDLDRAHFFFPPDLLPYFPPKKDDSRRAFSAGFLPKACQSQIGERWVDTERPNFYLSIVSIPLLGRRRSTAE